MRWASRSQGFGGAQLALQVFQPFARVRDFEAADRDRSTAGRPGSARCRAQPCPSTDRSSFSRSWSGKPVREHGKSTRRYRTAAPGPEPQCPASHSGEMVHGTATYDARADDNQTRVGCMAVSPDYTWQWNRPRIMEYEMRPNLNKSLDIDISVRFIIMLPGIRARYPTRWCFV